MLWLLRFFNLIFCSTLVNSIDIRIDGAVSFDQNWKFLDPTTPATAGTPENQDARVETTPDVAFNDNEDQLASDSLAQKDVMRTDNILDTESTTSELPPMFESESEESPTTNSEKFALNLVSSSIQTDVKNNPDGSDSSISLERSRDILRAKTDTKKSKRRKKTKAVKKSTKPTKNKTTTTVVTTTTTPTTTTATTTTTKRTRRISRSRTKRTTTEMERITKFDKPVKVKESARARLLRNHTFVRDDPKIQNFTQQIFNESLAIFAALRSKVNTSRLKSKVDYLTRSFRKRFNEFVNDTQDQKIVTRLGHQKVILNLIETSKRYTNRLVNYLIADIWDKGTLRNNEALEKDLRNEVENKEKQEYINACLVFKVCRSNTVFSDFLSGIFTVLLEVEEPQLRQGLDALTEVLKNTKFGSEVLDKRMRTKLDSMIERVEKSETSAIKPMVWMLRNAISTRNQPLIVPEKTPIEIINKTVAVGEVLDIFDRKIKPTEENVLQWNDIQNGVVQWANRRRKDIQDIMQTLVRHVLNRGIRTMSYKALDNLHDGIKVILS